MTAGMARGQAGRVAMLAPIALLYIALLLLPLAYMLPLAFDRPVLGQIAIKGDLSLANFARLFGSPFYLRGVANSVGLSALVTVLAITVGIPLAWSIARIRSIRALNGALLLLLAAMQVDVVLRLFGMVTLLGNAGAVNQLLGLVGLPPLQLLYNQTGVTIGLVQIAVPVVVLALVGAIRQLDPAVIEVARSLGASNTRILVRIVLPWVAPQLAGAALLVFGIAVSSYVVPAVLAGGRVPMLALQAYEQIMGIGNWQFGAALAVLLFLVANLVVALNLLLGARFARQGRG